MHIKGIPKPRYIALGMIKCHTKQLKENKVMTSCIQSQSALVTNLQVHYFTSSTILKICCLILMNWTAASSEVLLFST